jgi:hypothetical protein
VYLYLKQEIVDTYRYKLEVSRSIVTTGRHKISEEINKLVLAVRQRRQGSCKEANLCKSLFFGVVSLSFVILSICLSISEVGMRQ